MVDIEQSALCPFHQHALLALDCRADESGRVREKRQHTTRERLERYDDRIDRRHRLTEGLDHRRPLLERDRDLSRDPREVHQITGTDAGAANLVLVCRTDAFLGRSDALPLLTEAVHQHVVRKNEVRAIADYQALGNALLATSLEIVDLAEQYGEVEHHALPDHAARALA